MTGHIFSGLANTSKRDTFGWRRAKAYTNSTIFDTRLYASDWCIRLVGSWKWWVSLTEYRLFYRTLLQKRPMSCVDLSCMHLYASDRCIHDRSSQDWWRELRLEIEIKWHSKCNRLYCISQKRIEAITWYDLAFIFQTKSVHFGHVCSNTVATPCFHRCV